MLNSRANQTVTDNHNPVAEVGGGFGQGIASIIGHRGIGGSRIYLKRGRAIDEGCKAVVWLIPTRQKLREAGEPRTYDWNTLLAVDEDGCGLSEPFSTVQPMVRQVQEGGPVTNLSTLPTAMTPSAAAGNEGIHGPFTPLLPSGDE